MAPLYVCGLLGSGERKCYLSNHPDNGALAGLAAVIKARWVCEQAHQQLKQELGLGHYEGRGWIGLHHHLVLAQIAFAFLQHLRLREKSRAAEATGGDGPPPQPTLPQVRRRLIAALTHGLLRCPYCRQCFAYHLRL